MDASMGSILYWALDIGAIIVGVVVADRAQEWWKKHKLNINCDNCNKPRKTTRTPDRKFYLCRACMTLYKQENPIIRKKETE